MVFTEESVLGTDFEPKRRVDLRRSGGLFTVSNSQGLFLPRDFKLGGIEEIFRQNKPSIYRSNNKIKNTYLNK